MTLYKDYRDYIIKDGKFIGQFEQMYKDFDNPWDQIEREIFRSEKAVVLNLINKYKLSTIVELGCGLGHFSKQIHDLNVNVLGVDISETAIKKAKKTYPQCNFMTADILDFNKYYTHNTDCIIMSELTWYVFDRLEAFIETLKRKGRERISTSDLSLKEGEKPLYLFHLLGTYPEGVQKYGTDKFTNLKEILAYFPFEYEEYGEFTYRDLDWAMRTYFITRIA